MSISGKSSATKKLRTDVPFLEQTAGAGWGRTFELSREKLTIGRTTDNEIVLDSTSVSRVHAVLKNTARGWFIEDNISKNGIWVNGIAVKKALLRPNDVIQIGEFVFRYCDPQVPPVARPEDSAKSIAQSKTEVLSTDTWNVVPETTPQKPPIEDIQAPPQTPYIPPRSRPEPRRPEPMRLASFAKDNQEKLYLAMGLVGGLLVGTLLYMRMHREPSLPVPVASTKSGTERGKPLAAQDAFRQIAEAEELQDAAEVERPAAPAPAPAKPKASQALAKTAEEAKRPAVRPEEMQFGGKRKERAATKDISVYLSEGKAYLRDGDFESAALAFKFALVIDQNNADARAGLTAAQHRKRSYSVDETVVRAAREVKPKPKPEPRVDKTAEKKAAVTKLIKSAVDALKKRRYQDAIGLAEKARQIEIPGETAYLNEAKQIIDRSEQRQKEEFEPFIELAKQKMAEGDYRGSILLCEEMLRTDPGYAPAKECMERSTAGLAVGIPQQKSEGVK